MICPKYEALPTSKRCRHYLPNGACALPGELMCVEWLRANGHPVPVSGALPLPREPFRLQIQQLAPAAAPRPTSQPATPALPAPVGASLPARTPCAAISLDDLSAFKALGVELELDVGGAQVHLVPEYSREERLELSVADAATLRLLLDSFPGARVVHIGRTTNSSDQEVRHGQE